MNPIRSKLLISCVIVFSMVAFCTDTSFRTQLNSSVNLDNEAVALRGNLRIEVKAEAIEQGPDTTIACWADANGTGQSTAVRYVLFGSDSVRIKIGEAAPLNITLPCSANLATNTGTIRVRIEFELSLNKDRIPIGVSVRRVIKE